MKKSVVFKALILSLTLIVLLSSTSCSSSFHKKPCKGKRHCVGLH